MPLMLIIQGIITSWQLLAGLCIVMKYASLGFEVLTALVKNIAPCISYVNLRFGGTYHLHVQDRKS
jgi:hypothetical protein